VPYRHIVCAIDFHDPARAALRAAAALTRVFDAALTLVHVVAEPRIGHPGLSPEARFAPALRELAAATLADWQAEAAGLAQRDVSAELVEGVPWQRIVKLARERDADLLVLGERGESHVAQRMLGSVAERVARHAPCAVLVER
jgi:nucleotide-binding universal stress UspA family protein